MDAGKIFTIITLLEEKIHEISRVKTTDNSNKDLYGFIPLNFYRFQSVIDFIEQDVPITRGTNRKFLEVGSGIGTKILMAESVFNYNILYTGLEINKQYVEFAKEICKRSRRISFVNKDALKFNSYSKYDYIYFYCPAFNNAVEKKIEQRIVEQSKLGCIIFGFMNNSLRDDKRLVSMSKEFPIYQKVRQNA